MSRRHVVMLLALAAIWGAAFMLIEIGLRDLAPSSLIAGRIALAALVLAGVAAARADAAETAAGLRTYARPLAVAGVVTTAVPFYLIAWGQQSIDSGTSAILNASAPIWTAVLAAVAVHSQRVGGLRLAGVVVGFAGVVVLVGGGTQAGHGDVPGSLAVVLAAALYAAGALYVGRRLAGVPPLVVSLGTLAWASAVTLPVGLVHGAGAEVGWAAAAAVVGLGVGATAIAYLLYFGLIAGAGASRAILVTYLVPATAVLYGAGLLGEPLTLAKLAGLALILGGTALGTGAVRARRPASLGA